MWVGGGANQARHKVFPPKTTASITTCLAENQSCTQPNCTAYAQRLGGMRTHIALIGKIKHSCGHIHRGPQLLFEAQRNH